MRNVLYLILITAIFVGCKKVRIKEEAGAPLPPAPRTIVLSWDYPAEELTPDISFNVYHSSDISIPIRNWQVITNVPAPDLSVSLTVKSGAHFFAITALKNGLESDFSSVSRK